LRIRKQQITFLAEQQSGTYELRLTKFLKEQVSDAAAEPVAKLRPEVAAQIERAQGSGLSSTFNTASSFVVGGLDALRERSVKVEALFGAG